MASFPDVQRAVLRSAEAEAIRARLLAPSTSKLAAVSAAAIEAGFATFELATLHGVVSASNRTPTPSAGIAAPLAMPADGRCASDRHRSVA
jgi:hypothetical protein